MDKKHKKKLKRAAKKKKDRAATQEMAAKLNQQVNMFERLPGKCSACQKHFPKTREAHMTWRVAVKNKEQQVRLFCPDCIEKAKNLVEEHNEL